MSRIKNVLTKLMEAIAPLAPEDYESEVSYTKHATGIAIMHDRRPGSVTLWAYVAGETFRWRWVPGDGRLVRDEIKKLCDAKCTALNWGHAATLNREIREIEENGK